MLSFHADDSLCIKWTCACNEIAETKPAFEQLSGSLDASLVQEWTHQEHIAMEKRGDYLKAYVVQSDKCKKYAL